MAKRRRRNPDEFEINDDAIPLGRRRYIVIPASNEPDAYRFTSRIRQGRISSEVFCKNPDRRRELGLPIIYPEV